MQTLTASLQVFQAKDDVFAFVNSARREEIQREAWRRALGKKMVEAGNRMETDPVYRKQIQARTR